MKLLQTGHFWVFQGGIAYILEQEYGIALPKDSAHATTCHWCFLWGFS